MANTRLRGVMCLFLGLSAGCGESGSSHDAESQVCVPGQAIACATSSGCVGAQRCNESGTAYLPCECGEPLSGTGGSRGGPVTSTGGGGTSVSGSTGGVAGWSTALGGASSAAGGGPTVVTGIGGTTTGSCAPADMTAYSYPEYRGARIEPGSCTSTEIEEYYDRCVTAANCAAYESTACGACLRTSHLNDQSYGPLLSLGEAAILEPNIAGCIEVVGAPDCAPKLQIAALCEILACEEPCAGMSPDAHLTCMMAARNSSCAEVKEAAACIPSSDFVTLCTGNGFRTQFIKVASVLCG